MYIRPPKEAKTNKISRLRKCVYDLADNSRFWYLKLSEKLIKLGAISNKLNQGFLFWHKTNHAIGVIACFVDAML